MRAHDLAKLRRLRQIEDSKDGPLLTAAGRTVFNGLPKAAGQDRSKRTDEMLQHMERRLREAGRHR